MSKGYLQDISFVDFYGRPIVTAYSDELGYVVPLSDIVENHLELDWTEQRKKLGRSTTVINEDGEEYEVNLFNPVKVSGYDLREGVDSSLELEYPEDDIPVFAPNADYLCLPINELTLYLAQISINRVSIDVREKLFLYQRECAAVLHDYWFKGFAVNGRTNPSRVSSKRHDWCPREMSTKSLSKAATRYAAYAERNFDSRMNPSDIENFAKSAITNVLDLSSEDWQNQLNATAFLIGFMERAAFDILYFLIEAGIPPDNLDELIERNLENAWEGIGTLVLSVQSPYTPFPNVGRGSPRELK